MNDFNWLIMILIIIVSYIFVAAAYIKIKLEATNFEEMLFYSLCMDMIVNEGGITPFLQALKEYGPFVILLTGFFYLIFFGISGTVANNFYPLYFIRDNILIIIMILLVVAIIYLLKTIGILTVLRLEQCAKAPSPIVLTLDGIVTVSRLLQSENASFPIDNKPLGRTISLQSVLLKAPSPISLSPVVNTISVKSKLSIKASYFIVLTLEGITITLKSERINAY